MTNTEPKNSLSSWEERKEEMKKQSEETGITDIFVDTSQNISQSELDRFTAEIESIQSDPRTIEECGGICIQCDTAPADSASRDPFRCIACNEKT